MVSWKQKKRKPRKDVHFQQMKIRNYLNLLKKFDPNIRSNWHYIALQFYGRNARQCRERYNLFLKNGNRTKEKWTDEEDKIFIYQFQIHSPHWKKLGKYF